MAHILLHTIGMMMQQTLREAIEFSGIGLHTGCHVNVRIIPASQDAGITFIRRDIPGAPPIKAEASKVVATSYATSLGSKGVTISTVEHILAAFFGLGVDNATIELDGPEVPIMDGSASYFMETIEAVGLKKLFSPKKYIVIKKPIKVADRDKYVVLLPSEEMDFSVDYSIDFAHPYLNKQSFSGPFSKDIFREEVARARTFGFLRDIDALRANGLAKGGSLKNAIVISDTEILNEGGLRYPDEFVRHKVLDLMGDISLLGAPIIGRIEAYRSGHHLNHMLIQEVLKRPGRWEATDLVEKEASNASHQVVLATV